MIKRLKILLTTAILIVLTGCSYNSSFFIYNLTDQAVTIIYKLTTPSSYGVFVTHPEIYKIENEDKMNHLTKIDDRRATYSQETLTVTCNLNSNEALNIGDDLNFTITNSEERKRICNNVDKLTIINTASRDTLICNGKYIYLLLSELDDNVFGIRIE